MISLPGLKLIIIISRIQLLHIKTYSWSNYTPGPLRRNLFYKLIKVVKIISVESLLNTNKKYVNPKLQLGTF